MYNINCIRDVKYASQRADHGTILGLITIKVDTKITYKSNCNMLGAPPMVKKCRPKNLMDEKGEYVLSMRVALITKRITRC